MWSWVLVVYWLVLFTATHVPSSFPGVPSGHWDKVAHFSAYATLAFLFAVTWQVSAGILIGAHLRFAWLVVVAYGAFDELTQPFFGRTASWWDWIADGTGAAVGLAAFRWCARRWDSRPTEAEIDRGGDGI